MFVQKIFAGCKTLVEMQCLYLERESALDVLKTKISRRWVTRLDDFENVRIGLSSEESKGGSLAPGVNPVRIKVSGGVTFDGKQRRILGRFQVDVVFYGREEREEILFELKADEFFGSHVA